MPFWSKKDKGKGKGKEKEKPEEEYGEDNYEDEKHATKHSFRSTTFSNSDEGDDDDGWESDEEGNFRDPEGTWTFLPEQRTIEVTETTVKDLNPSWKGLHEYWTQEFERRQSLVLQIELSLEGEGSCSMAHLAAQEARLEVGQWVGCIW